MRPSRRRSTADSAPGPRRPWRLTFAGQRLSGDGAALADRVEELRTALSGIAAAEAGLDGATLRCQFAPFRNGPHAALRPQRRLADRTRSIPAVWRELGGLATSALYHCLAGDGTLEDPGRRPLDG